MTNLTPRNHLQTRSSVAHSVVFTDPEGGNATFSQNVNDGSHAVRPTDPSRNGYLFDGWFISDTDGESKVAYDFSQPITSKTVLTAHWTKQSNTWSINPNNGPVTGNTTVNIIPPDHSRGIRFNQVSAGGEQDKILGFSIGVASDGNAYAWGSNQYGQLGQDPAKTTAQNTPTKVPLPNGVAAGFTYTQVAAGGAHTLAIGSDGILYSWGRNNHGQLGDGTTKDRFKPQPVNVTSDQPFKAVQISAGAYDSAAIDDQGRVYTWGCENNNYSNTIFSATRMTPTLAKDPNGSSQGLHAVQVSVKWSFILALDEDGDVYAWGYNTNGQLGNGQHTGEYSTTYTSDPTPVKDPADNSKTFKATQISAGTWHALAVGQNASLYAWGKVNDTEYLTPSTAPIRDPNHSNKDFKATRISAGTWHSLAIDQDGDAWGWGWNYYGQTGSGSTSNQQATPIKVAGSNNTGQGFKAVCVSASHNHSLAIGQDGNAYAWGKNDYSQLGNTNIPTTGNSPAPVTTMFDPTPLQITGIQFGKTVGNRPTSKSDGTWTTTTPAHTAGTLYVTIDWTLGGINQTPTQLNYTYIGPTHSVIYSDPQGGHATFSQTIGDGGQASRPYPDPSRDGYRFDGWFLKDTKEDSNVAYDFSQPVTTGISLVAHWSPVDTHWSINPSQGNVLGGQQTTITPPGHSRGIRFNQVSAGGEQASVIGFSVGVASDGNAYAWGSNQYGQLGQDPAKASTQKTPTKVPLPDGVADGFTYTQVAAGGAHTLAIGSDGILYSWGRNDHGQLGNGKTVDHSKPQPVPDPSDTGKSFKAVQISAGAYDSAAIDDKGRVYTWGCEHNSYSSYGTDKPVPTLAKDPNGSSQGLHAVQISVKWSFILALDEDGDVYAWGYNTNGQLGNGTATGDGDANYANDPEPVQDPKDASKTFKATQISAGTRHALAIGKEDGSLYTWGKVNDTNYTRPTNDPANTGKTIKAISVSAGTWHSLAIDQDGNAWGWGWNQYGQTGNGNTNPQETPIKVTGPNGTSQGFKAVCISASHNHSLAIGQDGKAYAWGKNEYGQLGNTSIPANSPAPVTTMFDPTPLNITGVKFDQTVIGALGQNGDGSVTLATPAHNPGRADVIVDWSLGGIVQPTAHLAYTYEGTLPHAGSSGIVILLAAGLLAAAGTAAAGRHRWEARRLQA